MSAEPTQHTFDLVVVGGGITGAGVARDAALRGLSCLLLEKGDFASGTTGRTTRIVHGGLRYLERGELRLVSESLRERDTLVEMAPHLLHPLPILLPTYRGDRRPLWKIRAGLLLYEALGLGKGAAPYGILGPEETLRRAPFLGAEGLRGAGLYQDYQVPLAERLALENALSAQEHGAYCLNYHEVLRIEEEGGGFALTVVDRLDWSEHRYRARAVVNAAGSWADEVSRRYRPGLLPKVRPTKGVHIALRLPIPHAVFAASLRDHRLFLAAPLAGLTLVGTTDTPWTGDPDRVEADEADREYLLASAAQLFPRTPPGREDVLWSYAGLRPLVAGAGQGDAPARRSRGHALFREGPEGRFLTVVGGKYTTFRKMAEDAVDAACQALGHTTPCSTDRIPLVGGGMRDPVVFREDMCECTRRIPGLPRATVEHLVELYGRRCCGVVELGAERPEWCVPVAPGYRDLKAQVVYAVRREDAHRLDDVLLRRLRAGLAPDRGLGAAAAVARLMAEELGWDEATQMREVEGFRDALASTRGG